MITAKSSGRQNRRILRYLLIVNLGLWFMTWVTLMTHAKRYSYTGSVFEGPYPWQVILGWALSPTVDPMRYIAYKLTFVATLPSYLVTLVSFNIIFHGQRSPVQYLGTTVGGYELVVWMILSFAQWYVIWRFAVAVLQKYRARR